MRTYTRKRPQYQAIEGVTELCRLCLGSSEVTVPIFGDDADQLCATLSLRIMICVGLEMTRDNYLPNSICEGCYKELEQYYTFRKKCEVTYQKLKAHVLAMKERHYNTMTIKPKAQEDISQAMTVDAQDDGHQQLVLTFDENQQIQLVNLVNSNSIQLGTSENLFNSATLEQLSNEIVKPQDDEEHQVNNCTQDPTVPPLEIQASSSDLSLIMSTMLLELGVLQQKDECLVLVDGELNSVELEGADNTKIVLQLVEEDEEEKIENVNGEKESILVKSSKKPTSLKKTENTTCQICNKKFASRSVLTRHSRVHTGARPYACAVCQRRFAQRAVLTRHELVHREKRPWACASCPKSFTQRAALALHACAVCDKLFLHASGLSRHMSVHAGRRYSCATCGRVYADASALARHVRRHASTDTTQLAPSPPE